MVEKIKKFMSDHGREVVVILRTPRVGEEVDNGYGMEFELPEWIVIFSGESLYEENLYHDWYKFLQENDTDCNCFDIEGCTTLDGFVQELHDRDGYEVVWKKK